MAYSAGRNQPGAAMNPGRGAALLMLIAMAGCVTSARADAGNHPGITLLNADVDVRVAQTMSDCVASSVTKQNNAIRIMTAQQAKNALFPWLEQSVASFDPKQTAVLLSNRMIRDRAREIQLRYVVFLTEARGSWHMNGPFLCGGGEGGGGCLGAARISRGTTVRAVVWDLERGRQSDLSAVENATDLLLGLVLPLWIPGGLPTTTQACHAVAQRLVQMAGEPDTRSAQIWKSAAELADAVESAEGATNCLDAFTEQTTGDDSDAQRVEGVMWFDGTSSVSEFMSRQPALTRLGSIAIAQQFLSFASTPGSQPEQHLRIPFSELQSVTMDGGATTLVLLNINGACRAAFQVLGDSPSVVKQHTEAIGNLLAQRLADSRNHTGAAAP